MIKAKEWLKSRVFETPEGFDVIEQEYVEEALKISFLEGQVSECGALNKNKRLRSELKEMLEK